MTEHEVRVRAALPPPLEAKLAKLEEAASQSVAIARDIGDRLREARDAAAFATRALERARDDYRRGLRRPLGAGVAVVVEVEPPPDGAQAVERATRTVERLATEYAAASARAQNLLRLVERCRAHLGLGRETRRAAA
jgi:hypothetical protein